MPAKKARSKMPRKPLGLLERLVVGPVICAEGYLFEFERRGYLQAGAYVPEVVLEHPDLVEGLHRDFVHAGSDVVEAFTYYAHRVKLKIVGREKDLAKINRTALAIARKVARSTGTLLAGDICNTSIYGIDDASSHRQARRIFDEQVGWAVYAGVDFIVGETYSFGGEALLALEAIKHSGKPAVITVSVPREGHLREGWTAAEACRRLEDAGADVVGMNCARGPATMLPLRRAAPRPQPGRGARAAAAREPVLAGHVEAHLVRHRQATASGLSRVRPPHLRLGAARVRLSRGGAFLRQASAVPAVHAARRLLPRFHAERVLAGRSGAQDPRRLRDAGAGRCVDEADGARPTGARAVRRVSGRARLGRPRLFRALQAPGQGGDLQAPREHRVARRHRVRVHRPAVHAARRRGRHAGVLAGRPHDPHVQHRGRFDPRVRARRLSR